MPIGAGVALAIGLGSAGASAATSIYSSHKAGSVNEKSLAAQAKADADAAAIEREKIAANERARKDAMAVDQQHWNDYVRVHEPIWQTGQQAYRSLLDLANGGSARSQPALPQPSAMPSGAPMSAPPPASRSLMDLATGSGPSSAPVSPGRMAAAMPMPATPNASGMSLMDLAKFATMMDPNGAARGFDTGSRALAGLA